MSKQISENKFTSSVNLLFNPCIPQKYLGPQADCIFDDSDDAKYLISRELKDKVVKTGDGEDDYVIEPKLVETERVERQAYIESFKDDVGILNILKKVELSGDFSLLNERVRSEVPVYEDGKEKVVDVSGITDPEAVRNGLKNVSDVLNKMPADLKEAILNLQGEELDEFLKNYGAVPVTDKKDGE